MKRLGTATVASLLFVLSTVALTAPFSAYAIGGGLSNALGNISTIGTQGVVSTDLPKLVGNIIGTLLGVMGIVFVILIIYAGILYMQAGMDVENAKKAKKLIINATIGLIIIAASY